MELDNTFVSVTLMILTVSVLWFAYMLYEERQHRKRIDQIVAEWDLICEQSDRKLDAYLNQTPQLFDQDADHA